MIGYRDNNLFGDGYTDPLEVSYYETSVLGNTDIPDHILNQKRLYGITEEEYGFLRDICEYNVDEIDKWYFQEIIQKYIGDRNCCLWLCKSPEDVYNSYVAPMSGETVPFEELIAIGIEFIAMAVKTKTAFKALMTLIIFMIVLIGSEAIGYAHGIALTIVVTLLILGLDEGGFLA